MPFAARVGDMHVCPMITVLVPHVGGPILPPGALTVLIGGMPAARVGDMCVCVGPPDVIALGSFTTLFGGMPAARLGDLTAHGGAIVGFCPTVIIDVGGGGGGGGGAAPGTGKRTDLKSSDPADMKDPESAKKAAAAGAPPAGAPGATPPPAGAGDGADATSSASALNASPTSQAAALTEAAENGTPFVERCPYAHH